MFDNEEKAKVKVMPQLVIRQLLADISLILLIIKILQLWQLRLKEPTKQRTLLLMLK